jgi:isopenicillin N synthase-like dioxygenase
VNPGILRIFKYNKLGMDLFVIMGRKMEMFANQKLKEPIYKSTTHRVALPLHTERSSLLYFLDVPV